MAPFITVVSLLTAAQQDVPSVTSALFIYRSTVVLHQSIKSCKRREDSKALILGLVIIIVLLLRVRAEVSFPVWGLRKARGQVQPACLFKIESSHHYNDIAFQNPFISTELKEPVPAIKCQRVLSELIGLFVTPFLF